MIIDRCSQDNMGVVPLVHTDFKEKKGKSLHLPRSYATLPHNKVPSHSLSPIIQ